MAERKPPARRRTTRTTQSVQAEVETGEVVEDGKVDFMGATFTMASKVGLWPLIAFSLAQKKGIDSADASSLVAMGELILDCLDESEWDRFGRHAIATKAGAEDFMGMVQKVIEALMARPSQPPGDSSAGRPTTSQSLRGLSSRPDLLEGMTSPEDLAR